MKNENVKTEWGRELKYKELIPVEVIEKKYFSFVTRRFARFSSCKTI